MNHFHAVIAFILALLLFSCKKNDRVQSAALPDGDYAGTFQVATIAGPQAKSHVTLHLAGGRFSGNSDIQYYPGICSGSYTVSGDSIRFVNGCNWPQPAGGQEILDGAYFISHNGDSIILESGFIDAMSQFTLKRP